MTSAPHTPGRTLVPRDTLGLALLAAFGLALLADLGSLAVDAETGHRVAKPLLMPLLAAYTLIRGGPRLLAVALLLGWGGDVLLLLDAEWAFLASMGSFALGHVCYLTLFGRCRTPKPLPPVYGTALALAVVLLWADLPADLRIPVAGYALLLTAMAWRSSGVGRVAGVGGALFLASDLIIATEVAAWPQPPVADLWIMLLYGVGQLLLTLGLLNRADAARTAGTGAGLPAGPAAPVSGTPVSGTPVSGTPVSGAAGPGSTGPE
ncbi:lysoplasmalogenase [Streptomyces yaizuensis]|uniref:Lysoplasmalogenase n=1 Tax=Streptomyces yaizuensis TaxID=2989713 RepID=A0ABQ5P7X9_9ACTN|nr:lysoplasmalogenase [Streptomyces sp. YSPA8]GLF98699.1 lysoplasmalogenase [Streptomyces sp. YSPA8]